MSRARANIYVDVAGYWRWRIRARNGRIIGASNEGFASKRGARNNLWNLAVVLDTGKQWELL